MTRWNLSDFALKILNDKLSLLDCSRVQENSVYEDCFLLRAIKIHIHKNITKDFEVNS